MTQPRDERPPADEHRPQADDAPPITSGAHAEPAAPGALFVPDADDPARGRFQTVDWGERGPGTQARSPVPEPGSEPPRAPAGALPPGLPGLAEGARVRDVMTREVQVVAPGDTIQRAAQIMRDADVGAVLVCDGRRLQGMVTDRDLAVRAVAAARPATDTQVAEVMTPDVFWCREDDDLRALLGRMGDRQVRRIPVLDADRNLVGIVSLGDVASATSLHTDRALQRISEPSRTVTGD